MILDLPAIREQWETNGHLTEVQQEWLLTEVDRLTRERDEALQIRDRAEALLDKEVDTVISQRERVRNAEARQRNAEAARDALAALARVQCDDPTCAALEQPRTVEEYAIALDHWRNHRLDGGCSHGC